MKYVLGSALLFLPFASSASADFEFVEDDRNARSDIVCFEPGSSMASGYHFDIGFPLTRFQDREEAFVQDDAHAGFDWNVGTVVNATFAPDRITADGGILAEISGDSNDCLNAFSFDAEAMYSILVEFDEPQYVSLQVSLDSHPERGAASVGINGASIVLFDFVNGGDALDVTLEGIIAPGLYTISAGAQGGGRLNLDQGESQSRVYAANFALSMEVEDVCPGDVNRDGIVDFNDVLGVLSLWGPCHPCAADFVTNGVADFEDLLVVLASWGPCG